MRRCFDHKIVKGWLVEIGEVLGYYVKTEFESSGYRISAPLSWYEGRSD